LNLYTNALVGREHNGINTFNEWRERENREERRREIIKTEKYNLERHKIRREDMVKLENWRDATSNKG
jgi:hypothetical protein